MTEARPGATRLYVDMVCASYVRHYKLDFLTISVSVIGLGQGELKRLFIPLAAGKFKVIFNIFKLSKVLDQDLG